MKRRGVLATLLALVVPIAMTAVARAGTDTGAPGIVVTTPSPGGYTSYGGVRLQAIGATGPTFDEYLGVADLSPAVNRVEMNFSPASFALNGNSGGTSGDCSGTYAVGSIATPSSNAFTLTWDASAGTLTSRFVDPSLTCTIVFRNFSQELANAKGWTLARAQTALADVNAVRVMADDRQAGSLLSMSGGTVDGGVALGGMDPGRGTSGTWLGTGYDFDAPNGFTVSGTLNLGGSFGTCESTCALELTFGQFTPPNQPPVVSEHAADASGDHGTVLSTHGAFSDPDGDPLSIVGTGAGVVTDNGDGTWSWQYIPSNDGSDTVSISASDGKGGTATDRFAWTAVNAPPVVDEHASDATGHRGDTLTTHGSFTDANGDPLSIGGSGAGHMTDNGDGTWSWHYVPSAVGAGSVSVTASDGDGGTVTDTFAWTAVNVPPEVSAYASDATGNEGDTLTTQGSFTDDDGDPLSLSSAGAGAVTDNGDGTWSWTYVPLDDGNGTVTVTASDGEGGTATDTFAWSAGNVPPTIVSLVPDATTALAGQDVTWTATATDPGVSDTFTWWFDGGAGQPGALTTTYTRTYSDCGTYALDARIADDDGGSDHATSEATVTVVKASALSPVDPSGITLVQKGQTLPVKVQVGCGSFIESLHPGIGLEFADRYYPAESASSADTPGVMRLTSDQYQYDLRVPRALGGVELSKGDRVTILVEPFGDAGSALPIVLQIRK